VRKGKEEGYKPSQKVPTISAISMAIKILQSIQIKVSDRENVTIVLIRESTQRVPIDISPIEKHERTIEVQSSFLVPNAH
jgi:hypothetical protein